MPVKTCCLVGTSLELLLTPMNWCKVFVCLWMLYIHSLCIHSRKLREAGPSEDGIYRIGNDIFSVKADLTLSQSLDLSQNQPVPLFGAKYNFWLHEVVDLPEYLIHMPLLIRFVITLYVPQLCSIPSHYILTLHPHTTISHYHPHTTPHPIPSHFSMLSDFGMELVTQQNFHDFFTDHRHKPEDLGLLFKMHAFSQESVS